MTTSLNSAEIEAYLLNWLELMREKNEEQIHAVKNNSLYVPYIGVPKPVVRTIFKISKYFNINNYAKYLAVHLFDQLMCTIFWEIIRRDSKSVFANSGQDYTCKLSGEAKLHLMSCIQIANKIDSNANELSTSNILIMLQKLEPHKSYNRNHVIASEQRVLNILNWTIPTQIPLNCVEILIACCDLMNVPSIENVYNSLLDKAYLCHDELYSKFMALHKKINGKEDRKHRIIHESNSLLLAAVVVLTSTFILRFDKSISRKIVLHLSLLTKIIEKEIWDSAKLFFFMVIVQDVTL